MSGDKLGLVGASSIALGGMIGGGVFAVLGVVVTLSGSASWAAFAGACLVSTCAAYSYLRLNEACEERGGSVTILRQAVEGTTAAGMVGWTLLFGYVGAVAMYAFAFGSFFVELVGVHTLSLGVAVPVRPLASVVAVAGFVALNLLGARASGTSETALVALKLAILAVFGGVGLYYGVQHGQIQYGAGQFTNLSLLTALAVSFVSFQGWQLLLYDQGQIRNPVDTLPKAIYLSIAVTVLVDGVVAVVVTSLAPTDVIAARPETALAVAARPFLGQIGFTLVAVAALFSTGSAVNGTLFSAANFAKGMLSDGLLPDRVGDGDADGAPDRTLVLVGVVSAAFSAYGSLQGITSFGSLAFMAVFGAMSYLALRGAAGVDVFRPIPALGVLGTLVFFPLLLYHLATAEPEVFGAVVLIGVAILAVELLYFESDAVREGLASVEHRL